MSRLSLASELGPILAAPRQPLALILAGQQRRLFELVAHAVERSPFYRERYANIRWTTWGLDALPPVTKEELNADLDRVVADRDVAGQSVRDFLSRPELAGRLLAGRYVALRTAGTTGRMGAVLYDLEAWNLFKVLSAARGLFGPGSGGVLAAFKVLSRRHRVAYVVAGGGHYSTAALATLAPRWSRIFAREEVFPIGDDEDRLIDRLGRFGPDVIHVYPTFADALARAQLEGRMRIAPRTISTSSEPLAPETRELLTRAFPQARISDCYGATECMVLGRQCPESSDLHVNADWAIVEPVDAELRPVAYGEQSHRVLVTNLANRVMPFIRYVLDDVVTPIEPGPCLCGSNLPRIRIQGRVDDTIWLPRVGKAPLAVRPLALGSAMTRIAGLRQFQARQDGPLSIQVSYAVETGGDAAAVGRAVSAAIETLGGAGLAGPLAVQVAAVPAIPRDPVSGKVRRIVSLFRPVTGSLGTAAVVARHPGGQVS